MSRIADHSDHRSYAKLLAEIDMLDKKLLSLLCKPEEHLIAKVMLSVPSSGDIDGISHYYSNQLLLDNLQYTAKELDDTGSRYFQEIVHDKDKFIVSKRFKNLAILESGKACKFMFRMIAKNKDELSVFWVFTITEWHFRGRPKMILGCGIILDETFYDKKQFKEYLNRSNHSAKVAKAKKLDKDLWVVLELMYQQKSNSEMAEILHLSVEGVKSRKRRLMVKLEFACIKELNDFIFSSSLFC